MLLLITKKQLIILSILLVLLPLLLVNLMLVSRYTAKNGGNYVILVAIEEKRLYLFENNACIKEYPIASGMQDWPSPVGQWKITEKSKWGEGFGGHWMGLNVPWGKYGIHGTTRESSIGHAASHGCIRMYNKDVTELYSIVPVGTLVMIYEGLYGAFGSSFRKLQPGDRGADVLAVQQKLKELGFFEGRLTGIYGDNLKTAIYRFQKEKNLTVKYTLTEQDYHAMGFYEFE